MLIHVFELPRGARKLFEGGIAASLRFVAARAMPGMTRLALVASASPPAQGPDAVAAVPLMAFGDWEARAADAVEAWERRWLLIESMPARHRAEARADLHHAVASALIAAAVNGVDSVGRPDDLLF